MPYTYLACPYSDKLASVRQTRYLQVAEVTAKLLLKDIHVYSPIVHCHDLALRFKLPADFTFWCKYNYAMLAKASSLTLLELDGWETSKGVQAEIQYATNNSIPIQRLPYPLEVV